MYNHNYHLRITYYLGENNMMHKEVVERKRTHVIALILLLITCVLYIVEGIQALRIENLFVLKVCEFILLLFTIIFIILEYLSCKVAYKYSLIADKLIINKIYNGNEINLESIKLSDILYLGKRKEIPKEYRLRCTGKYTCELFGHDKIYCVYKKENEVSIFNFEPSEDFIRRITKYKKAV